MCRIWDVASRARTEPSQPVSRNNVVQRVEQWPWHDAEHSGNRPRPAEVREHSDRARRLEPCATTLEQHISLEVDGIEVEMAIDGLPEWALRRHEPKDAAPIVPQDELGEPRTQHALPVENDDRPVVRKIRYGRVVPVAECAY